MTPSHVLVPLDGSPLSDDALVHALDVYDCQVTVLNVVSSIDESMSEGGVLEPGPDRRAAAQERSQRVVDDAKRRAAEMDRDVETAVESGDPAEVILDFVESNDVDQVVMGGHGGDRGAVARRLLGTVATKVVGDAPVTVTVVR